MTASSSGPATPGNRAGGGGPRPHRPTLQEVADRAGVSLKTASRALNREPHVAEATGERVRRAADELGFRLNALARELRSGATSTTAGLVIGDVGNPYYSRIARGVEREMDARGLQLITSSTDDDPERERVAVAGLLERRVAALLVVPSSEDHRYLESERAHGLPVVFLDRPAGHIDADTFVLDDRAGARAAVEHLLKAGHERIGLVGDFSRLSTHRARVAGHADAMQAAGVQGWETYVRADCHDLDAAAQGARDLLALPEPPTALFTTNNRCTTGALRAVAGLPARPEIVGFDDFDLADVLGVTVVAHDPEEMGRLAARAALARLDGDDSPPRTVVLPTRLVVRTAPGTEPPPVRDRPADLRSSGPRSLAVARPREATLLDAEVR
ncbi:LacI family DNA-binding transcriptional regulator [Motilibacter deserti]|uniref:LacI family transcriptional regulator n=1 Tax=Motilibacter deserti TaxID=2714956 RepID=A0ABX0GWR7_9ACTN|nr:LacI family DNA-binding transcriptional regulator [Motilibacter deserti]NHC14993.1 LacI family transcriptional regulator [Motilibacter deserti]